MSVNWLKTAVNEIELNWDQPPASPPTADDVHYWLAGAIDSPIRIRKIHEVYGRCALVEFDLDPAPATESWDPVVVVPCLQMPTSFTSALATLVWLQQEYVRWGGVPFEGWTHDCYVCLDVMQASMDPLTDEERAFFDRHMRRIISQPRAYLDTGLSQRAVNLIWAAVLLGALVTWVVALRLLA